MVENIVSRESRRKRRAHTHTRGVSTILFDIYGHLIPMRSRLFISFHVQHIDPYNSSVFGWAWFITRAKRKPSLFSFFHADQSRHLLVVTGAIKGRIALHVFLLSPQTMNIGHTKKKSKNILQNDLSFFTTNSPGGWRRPPAWPI